MANRLFVGGLPWSVNDSQLQDLFSKAGTVVSAKVITDRDTGRSKGFGFVEMQSDEEAQKAIDMLNETEIEGRKIAVNIARPMEERPQRSFDRRPSFDNRRSQGRREDHGRGRGSKRY